MKTKLGPRCSMLTAILVGFTQLSILDSQTAHAQSPLPDSFNPAANGSVSSLAVQADGKILVGGNFTTLGGQTLDSNGIGRLNPDGTVHTTSFHWLGNSVSSLAVQADGKILVSGDGWLRYALMRLNADGTQDWGFNPAPGPDFSSVYSLVVQADGKIVVGGNFTTLVGQTRSCIGRLNANGTLDSGFNPGANDVVHSLAVQADGKILVGGEFTRLGGQTRYSIGRLNANGSLDSGFNPGTECNGYFCSPAVYSLAVQADGKILVGGVFTTLGGASRYNIGRLNTGGTPDSGFGPEAVGRVESLAVQADGKILVGGWFTTLGGAARNYIGRLNANGTLDSGFNPGANNYVYSLAVQPDGRILVGGVFTALGGQTRNYIGRLYNTSPATQSLSFESSAIIWLRGGSSPEVWRTTFDLSTDALHGRTWVWVRASRTDGKWQLLPHRPAASSGRAAMSLAATTARVGSWKAKSTLPTHRRSLKTHRA